MELSGAIVGHLVGDYILQTDALASGKKKDSFVCAIHCFIWSYAVVMFAQWPWWTAGPLFIAHFIQDRTNIVVWWMDTIGQKQFRTGVCSPWSVIVVDNVWHLVAIWCISKFIAS